MMYAYWISRKLNKKDIVAVQKKLKVTIERVERWEDTDEDGHPIRPVSSKQLLTDYKEEFEEKYGRIKYPKPPKAGV